MKNLQEISDYLKALHEWIEEYKKWYAQWKAKSTAAFDDGGSNPPPPPPKPPGT